MYTTWKCLYKCVLYHLANYLEGSSYRGIFHYRFLWRLFFLLEAFRFTWPWMWYIKGLVTLSFYPPCPIKWPAICPPLQFWLAFCPPAFSPLVFYPCTAWHVALWNDHLWNIRTRDNPCSPLSKNPLSASKKVTKVFSASAGPVSQRVLDLAKCFRLLAKSGLKSKTFVLARSEN